MFNKENIKSIVHSLFFERFITIVILVNSILVGVETAYQIDIIKIVQASCLIIFVIEISMRFIARDSIKSFFKDGWNIFDLVIVIISLIPENISMGFILFSNPLEYASNRCHNTSWGKAGLSAGRRSFVN